MQKKGVFITFEGIEASGKSTQAKKLYRWLLENNINALLTRDPGGTRLGEEVRNILLKSDYHITPVSEAFLYAACRAQLTFELIRPALLRGEVVVSDRFSDSFIAYQGYGRGIELDQVIEMDRIATGGLKPDLTFLLDLPVEKAFQRIGEKDRMESEEISFHERVRSGFLKIAEKEKDRIIVLDALKPKEELFLEIKKAVEQIIVFPA